MATTSVAFFRNLNQGQRGSPSTEQLVAAFIEAGATVVRPVGGNGTVLFDALDPLEAAIVAAQRVLAWGDVVFVRAADWVERVLVLVEPAADSVTEVTVFDSSVELAVTLPYRSKRCTVVAAGHGFAVVVNDRPGLSDGTPTIERLIGSDASSRSVATVRRVLAAFG